MAARRADHGPTIFPGRRPGADETVQPAMSLASVPDRADARSGKVGGGAKKDWRRGAH